MFSVHCVVFPCEIAFAPMYSAALQRDSIEKFSMRKKYPFFFSYLLIYDRREKKKNLPKSCPIN